MYKLLITCMVTCMVLACSKIIDKTPALIPGDCVKSTVDGTEGKIVKVALEQNGYYLIAVTNNKDTSAHVWHKDYMYKIDCFKDDRERR